VFDERRQGPMIVSFVKDAS